MSLSSSLIASSATMSRAAATASLRVSGSQSHAASQNPPIRRLGGHEGKKGFEKSSFATARVALRAILGPLYPTPDCLGIGTRVLQALVGGVLLLMILRGMMSFPGSSSSRSSIRSSSSSSSGGSGGRSSRSSSGSDSYPSLSMKGVSHLSPSCRNLTSLPYPPHGHFGPGE